MSIVITGMGSVSALGHTRVQVLESYSQNTSKMSTREVDQHATPVGQLNAASEGIISELARSRSIYGRLDRSVLLAIHAAREGVKEAGWQEGIETGINIGSSRGATGLFEMYHRSYLAHPEHRVSGYASPTTTLGNISSWVGHDLGLQGIAFSHSITCSTALHAVLNAAAWIKSGMCGRFIAGGSEASLTGFTIAQMRALRIYSMDSDHDYPCRPFVKNPHRNTFVLGEGAAAFCIEKENKTQKPLARLAGLGYATEPITHPTSISAEASCLQQSMRMALRSLRGEKSVDVIICHAPGTMAGDAAEFKAVQTVFGSQHPYLFSNKWLIGHTFGASGALNLELAIHFLREQFVAPFPYETIFAPKEPPQKIERVMVNAVGFGGNAASIILERTAPWGRGIWRIDGR
jgi:3-oxoacyl-(acyl-carrier-protein) synthase